MGKFIKIMFFYSGFQVKWFRQIWHKQNINFNIRQHFAYSRFGPFIFVNSAVSIERVLLCGMLNTCYTVGLINNGNWNQDVEKNLKQI